MECRNVKGWVCIEAIQEEDVDEVAFRLDQRVAFADVKPAPYILSTTATASTTATSIHSMTPIRSSVVVILHSVKLNRPIGYSRVALDRWEHQL
jgi:hypothetical protein